MKALLKKDANWLLFFLAFGTAIPLFVILGYGFRAVWVDPSMGGISDLMIVWWIGPLALGAFGAIRDELTRTEEYLRHRPISRRKIFNVKVGACLALVVFWLAAPLAFQMLFPGLWDRNAPIAQWGRFWHYLGAGSIALSVFAAAFCAGSLRVGWIQRIVIGAALEFFLFVGFVQLAISLDERWANSLGVYVALNVALTALFLVVAYGNHAQGRDPDRPMVGKTGWLTAVTLGVGLIFSATFVIAQIQEEFRMDVIHHYPWIVEDSEGAIRLITVDSEGQTYAECDAEHSVKGAFHFPEDDPGGRSLTQWWTYQPGWDEMREMGYHSWFGKFFDFGGRWERIATFEHNKRCYLNSTKGLVHLYKTKSPRMEGEPAVVDLRKGPKAERFSTDVERIWLEETDHVAVLADLSDGTIWKCDLSEGEERFESAPLPGGDRYLGCKTYELAQNRIVRNGQTYERVKRTYVIGSKGAYVWNGTSFETAPDEIIAHSAALGERFFVVTRVDPIAPAVEFRGDGGEILFSHRYGLFTGAQKFRGALVYFMSLLRAPLLQIASFGGVSQKPRATFLCATLIDPLLNGRNRLWLLGANLLVGVILALCAVKRLAQMGLSKGRRLFWALSILLGGVMVALLCAVLETRRAYRVTRVIAADDVPPLLIGGKA